MTQIRFFTDEDVYGSIAPKLRERGFDAVSTPEAQRLRESDQSQLAWATQEGRVLVTFNVADFGRLHHEWVSESRHHAGIIVSRQRPIGDLLRRLFALASSLSREDMQARLEYLTDW
jgi:hypothetical protein